MQNLRTNKMETVPVNKLLLSLSLPIMFSMMIALGVGTCVGVNAFLARTLGQKNIEKARAITQHGELLALFSYAISLLIGLFFTRQFFTIQTSDTEIRAYGVDYMSICLIFSIFMFGQLLFEKFLQANGRALLSMVSQLIGAIVNIILDPILIFGLAGFPVLGARGAAIATVVGQFTAFVSAFILNQHFNKELKFSFAKFGFDMSIIKQIYKIGLPAIIMQSIGSVANFFLNGILLTFSTAATAVLDVYYKLQNFIFMPVYGLTSGMLPIMSYNLGAKKIERVKCTKRYGMLYMAIIMLTGTLIFQAAPTQLLLLFDASEEMRGVGILALRIISLYFVFEGFCLISHVERHKLVKKRHSTERRLSLLKIRIILCTK